jgi:hypothetical protein
VDRGLVFGAVEVGELVLDVLHLGLDGLVLLQQRPRVLQLTYHLRQAGGLRLEAGQLDRQVLALRLARGLQFMVLGHAALVLAEGLRGERLPQRCDHRLLQLGARDAGAVVAEVLAHALPCGPAGVHGGVAVPPPRGRDHRLAADVAAVQTR